MIGSFWNLCRACPSMPVDKLHSEYRSTYRWHEYTGPRQDVVRKPPAGGNVVDIQPVQKSTEDEFHTEALHKLEPAMPRRKKYPDIAYRHHEFIGGDEGNVCNSSRARSEERGEPNWRPSRRSRSEGPVRKGVDSIRRYRECERRRESDPDMEKTGAEGGLIRKALSKISTEYRLQFAWPPQTHISLRDTTDSQPRKSQSMGALKANGNIPMVHKKRMNFENRDASELEPLVDATAQEVHNSEYKKNFRPFSDYSEGHHSKVVEETRKPEPILENNKEWYNEVKELRKKADEYKTRGWGSDLAPDRVSDLYNKQVELWDQVSRRSSLSALSLASMTHKNYTKEEKEKDNNRKSSPSKATRNAENKARMIRDIIRHHLEKTTGGSTLILSPTRDKLEPTIPRKDDDKRGSQKNSPKKTLNTSSLKKTPKAGTRKLRSQSVGPSVENKVERSSPKREPRAASVKERKSTPSTASVTKRPRPSSLNTTASSRSKISTGTTKNEEFQLAKPHSKTITNDSSKQKVVDANDLRKGKVPDTAKTESNSSEVKNTIADDEPDNSSYEPVVKSPPEPTRVKSPEQIITRSPDPVNWTVPLDTGKTFTVTQNVIEGDLTSRPHSEIKAWTPPEMPHHVVQSAPPNFPVQGKEQI